MAASILDAREIRPSEEAFFDLLFTDAPQFGAPVLTARAPRAYVDLNRAHNEFDPALIERAPRPSLNPRISAGLGVIPRVVSNGRPIYRSKILRAEAERRIALHWLPYHLRLQSLICDVALRAGWACVVDCHSMPHEAIETYSQGSRPRPEVVLGDRFGVAADPEVVERIETAFRAEGLRVARNAPFAGAYVTQAYGRPSRGHHVVQVEIDRALYMDEARILSRPDFEEFRQLLARVMARITGVEQSEAEPQPLAAE